MRDRQSLPVFRNTDIIGAHASPHLSRRGVHSGGRMPDRYLHQTRHRPPAACPSCALRPRARPRPAISGCPALGDLRGLQDLRRRTAAARSARDRGALRVRPKLRVLQPAGLRGAPFRAAQTSRGRFQHRHIPEHGGAHPSALARLHPLARHGGGAADRRVVRLRDGSVLNRYWDERPEPRPEAYRQDYELAQTLPAARREAFYRNVKATAESGWDFSSRWMRDPRDLRTLEAT